MILVNKDYLANRRKIIVTIAIVIVVTLITACSSDKTDLPQQRPLNTVDGLAVDGTMVNATVSIYGFDRGRKGAKLGTGTTNSDGEFSVQIRSGDQVLLIEITGGSYVEQSSGTTVNLESGQVLRGIANYVSGENIDFVMVSSLTHLTAALFEYLASTDTDSDAAFVSANETIDSFFSINALASLSTSSTRPINLQTDTANSISAESLYAFYLAGMSNWTAWAGSKNNQIAHESLTTIALLQVMYNDIAADGKLNGFGNAPSIPLKFGNNVTLNTDQYRAMFSINMQGAANLESNNTQLKAGSLETVALAIAGKNTELLGNGAPILNITEQQVPKPSLGGVDGYFSGTKTLFVDIGGYLTAKKLEWKIADNVAELDVTPWQVLDNPLKPEIEIDTMPFTDNAHPVQVRVTDQLNIVSTGDFSINIDNTGPTYTIDDQVDPTNNNSVPAEIPVNVGNPVLTGTYSDNMAGVQSLLIGGVEAVLNGDGTWSAEITVNRGENIVTPVIIDFAGNEGSQVPASTKIYFDDIPPEFIVNYSDAKFDTGTPPPTEGTLEQHLPIENPLYIYLENLTYSAQLDSSGALDFIGIPYYTFIMTDEFLPPAYSLVNKMNEGRSLKISIVHKIGGAVFFTRSRDVPESCAASADTFCVFNIALVNAHLGEGWQNDNGNLHELEITVTDPAGNETSHDVSFYAHFY